ncbi:MAG: hypothetical protein KDA44_01615 [Planctomycetales bacterium]|nr:hypothetical protein [Planctomycetales bacterium]
MRGSMWGYFCALVAVVGLAHIERAYAQREGGGEFGGRGGGYGAEMGGGYGRGGGYSAPEGHAAGEMGGEFGAGGYGGEMGGGFGGEMGGRGGYGASSTPDADDTLGESRESAKELAAQDAPATTPARIRNLARAAERINAVLDQPLKTPLEYIDSPLNQITAALQEDYDLPIVFDTAGLDAVAISPEVEISVRLSGGISLRSALELMLRDVEDLTYVVDNEVLLITSADEAAERLETRVYNVADLIDATPMAHLLGGDPTKTDYDSLIDALIASVEHDSWMENGTGNGEIQPLAPGMLLVTQTQRIHDQVAATLADIRRTRDAIVASSEVAPFDPPVAITVTFQLDRQTFPNSDAARTTISQALQGTVDWQNFPSTAGEPFLHVLGNRLLVRHTPATLAQVERALISLELIDPATRPSLAAGEAGAKDGDDREPRRGGF